MGEIADMMLDGVLCEQCGCLIGGEETGYPRLCEDCAEEQRSKKKKRGKKAQHGSSKRKI
ncbi:MAG: hypothetical protein ABF969_04100 [Sporolactobacillus sp.]